MGGGDLNMKKHFHPLTRENLEKVWKAEQKRDEELKRIEERKKEIAEEKAREELLEHASRHGVIKKRDERLEWMYAGYRANSEEFLLGKEITDAYLEKAAQERKKQKELEDTGCLVDLHTVDMARKIREDPLFLIKKREVTATRNVVENSQRIKQIIESSRRDSRRNTSRDSRRKDSVFSHVQNTPSNSKLSHTGWDTPKNISSRSKHHSDSSDSEDDSAKLQKMLQNGKWRESSRRSQIKAHKEEEDLDKQIEERLRKLKGNCSTQTLLNEIKMGTWSSKRYTK